MSESAVSSQGLARYVTTPLYYTNGLPTLGSAYSTILADILVSYFEMNSFRTIFLTGTDEHGEKIEASARSEALSPLEYTTRLSEEFRRAWSLHGLRFDLFYRTTAETHKKAVQQTLQNLKEQGEIYFAEYEGLYCVGCERFRTDTEWTSDGLCPDHLKPGLRRKESNYWFKMSNYQNKLIEHYEKNPDSIEPSFYRNEVLSFLKQPLEDLCISRPKERLSWGIELPFDKDYVTYVWFDALMNYVVALGFEGDLQKSPLFDLEAWKGSIHYLGKDILKTHAIYWPAMLMALGLSPPKRLQVGGFWLVNGQKMSKSLGNYILAKDLATPTERELYRYFFAREAPYGSDASYTRETFRLRVNAELANGLGNLASRVLTLVHKNFGPKFPAVLDPRPQDADLMRWMRELPIKMSSDYEWGRFHQALAHYTEALQKIDRYLNEEKPWSLAKDPTQKERLESVLANACQSLWILSVVLGPVLPWGARSLQKALGKDLSVFENSLSSSLRPSFRGAWSQVNRPPDPGTPLGEIPKLYPRLES